MALAVDYMVFNVTKDDIHVRMSAVDEEIWPSAPMKKKTYGTDYEPVFK